MTVVWLIYCEIGKCVRYVRTIAATVSQGFLTCERPTVETKTVSISRDSVLKLMVGQQDVVVVVVVVVVVRRAYTQRHNYKVTSAPPSRLSLNKQKCLQ